MCGFMRCCNALIDNSMGYMFIYLLINIVVYFGIYIIFAVGNHSKFVTQLS